MVHVHVATTPVFNMHSMWYHRQVTRCTTATWWGSKASEREIYRRVHNRKCGLILVHFKPQLHVIRYIPRLGGVAPNHMTYAQRYISRVTFTNGLRIVS